jgi:plastocyanin
MGMRRFLLLLVVLLAGCGSDDTEKAGSSAEAVELVATDFAFDQKTVTVEATGEATFRLVNKGATAHALEIEGNGVEEETDSIAPGESGELTVQLDAGEYEFYCPISNHRGLGMEGTLAVGGEGAADGGATTGETDTGEEDGGYGG